MEYIKSLSVVQKIALIAGPLVAINPHFFFGAEPLQLHRYTTNETIYFTSLAVCVAVYFLFPQKQSAG